MKYLKFISTCVLLIIFSCNKTDTWTQRADMPTKRYGPATSVVNGRIYLIGGADGYDALPVIEVYNPKNTSG